MASFAQQYNIRLHREYETISYQEYTQLLIGIGGDTPLGNTVQIRAETDRKKINEFNTYEKRIYNEWQEYKRQQNKQKSNVDSKQKAVEVQQWLKSLFGR